ncbi:hypothetical protein ABFS82_13G073700 [Erythranthe guttata]
MATKIKSRCAYTIIGNESISSPKIHRCQYYKLTTILSLVVFLLLALHTERAVSSFEDDQAENDDEEEAYVLDSEYRFLTTSVKKKKGVIIGCNGKKNSQVDLNNCGRCGKKCGYGKQCCGGVCTDVLKNAKNCGKCGKKCRRGVKCQYGFCGYA